jgi:dihydroorotate dehydrogenase electron transfer subunit
LGKYLKARVVSNLTVNETNNILTLKPLERSTSPVPGQFYMIGVADSHDPLLKRPFSFFRKTPEGLHFLYTVRGKGTAFMKAFGEGKIIPMIGPLGNGYPGPGRATVPLFVAGGTGIASVFSLIEKLSKKACVLYGARCKDQILVADELQAFGDRCSICTDDGSFGAKGTAVDMLGDFLSRHRKGTARFVIYACGPKPMLQAVSEFAVQRAIKGYLSLEENMACGFGACLGCAVKSVHGYKRVCREGPVFPMDEIVWEQ